MIEVRSDGHLVVAGTGFKVRILAEIVKYRGLSAEEIPGTYSLSLDQVRAGLAYYYDHQSEVDAEIERLERYAEAYWEAHPQESLVTRRLRRGGHVLWESG